MCLRLPKNQYFGAVMELSMENDDLCNTTLGLDIISNWTKNSSTKPTFVAPGYTDSTVAVIIVYCVMFVIAAAGNLSVVITLFRSRRHRRSRVSLMICHLAVADLMVAFIMIPLEVGWRITVEWHAGNIACKVFLFMRAFCLYLSSNVLVCVSLDRCFAVVYPLRVSDARKRGKIMLIGAWIIAFLYAIPQSIIFRVQQHPHIPDFWQCVTFGFFSTDGMETAYNLFGVIAMYFLPLMIISAAYSAIVCEISNRSNRSREKDDGGDRTASGALRLRCSALTHIERARQRTFRLTVTIVAVFIWCWTPYVVMTLWYVFDRESAMKVDNAVQDGLFLMAVSNSCMNPLIYGSYAMKCRLPWNRKRSNDVVLGGNAGLQRRSTDAVLDTNNYYRRDQRDFRFTRNSYKTTKKNYLELFPNGSYNNNSGTFTRTSAVTKFTTGRTECQNNWKQSPSQVRYHQTFQTQSTPCPSRDQIAVITDNRTTIKLDPRPSFHSDPTPHNSDQHEPKCGLTRSLDTGGWR